MPPPSQAENPLWAQAPRAVLRLPGWQALHAQECVRASCEAARLAFIHRLLRGSATCPKSVGSMIRSLVAGLAIILAIADASILETGQYLGALCGNVTGPRAYTVNAVQVEQEALLAYQSAFEAAAATSCELATSPGQPELVGCPQCLVAYRAFVCLRHLPCMSWTAGINGSCTASAMLCDNLCTDVQRVCPFDLAGSLACPIRGEVVPGLPQHALSTTVDLSQWPTARWDSDLRCFAGWGQ